MDQPPRDKMDRSRLKQIEQSDLTEGRVNQDFVYWLKSKGVNWLLVVLAALCVYMVVVRWKQHGMQKQTDAWEALATADLPRSLEDLAAEYDDVDAVPELALMTAARRYLHSVRAGAALNTAATPTPDPQNPNPPPPPTEPLTEQQRGEYLDEAERLYQAALASLQSFEKDAPATALLRINALEGLASVAEAQGDAEAAKKYYNQAAEAAGDDFPKLASQARSRAESVENTVQVAALPTRAETGGTALRQGFTTDTPSTVNVSPSLQRIIDGEDDEPGDSSPTASAASPAGPE